MIRTTPADAAALNRFAKDAARGAGDYLPFISQFPPPSHEQLRKRDGPRGEPFRLP
ncbi:MAG: hypothetical protein ABR567_06830 [Myxococcales bacterium]|nr:hypothetical protein [Myxococcales bacterium]